MDVLGLCEAQMRLLEGNAAKAQDEEALKKEGNAVIRDMLAARKRFDLDRYFASLCTNQVRTDGRGLLRVCCGVWSGHTCSPTACCLHAHYPDRWCAWRRTCWSST